MAPVQNWAARPRTRSALIGTANTNVDGTGTIVAFFPLADPSPNGCRVDRLTIQALGPTTQGKVFLYVRSAEETWRLYDTVLVAAATPGAAIAHFRATIEDLQLDLEPDQQMGASTLNAESFVVHGEGGDY
jgi:hypothetical protein